MLWLMLISLSAITTELVMSQAMLMSKSKVETLVRVSVSFWHTDETISNFFQFTGVINMENKKMNNKNERLEAYKHYIKTGVRLPIIKNMPSVDVVVIK